MRRRTRAIGIIVLLCLPLAGLALLLAVPSLDVMWQHQPSHFWLVLLVAFVNVVLGLVTSGAAERHGDLRTFMVSLVLLTTAGFLGLHALATPGVVLDEPNVGFAIATPVGLTLASVLAGGSAMDLERRSRGLRARWPLLLRLALLAVLVAWAVASLLGVPGLDATPQEATPPLIAALAPLAIVLYVLAAVRFAQVYRQRRRTLPLAVAVAFALLAEAMVAVVFGVSWQLSWWEWHVLMAIAFGVIFVAARNEYRREHSVTGMFRGLYLERTLERIDDRSSSGLAAFVDALESDAGTSGVAERLRRQGYAGEEIHALERSARELVRVDDLLRTYVGPRLASGLTEQPDLAALGGRETDISVLFADLAGFTSFSEGRSATEVVEMLNAYWAATVPAIVRDAEGLIERFAGDAVMAVFNALDDQPDHALRAVRAAMGVREAVGAVAGGHPEWPRFRIGVNSGVAVIGNVGTDEQHSFTAIGDTPNVAARVQAAAHTGEVLLSEWTYARVRARVHVEPIGAMPMKGKSQPLELYRLITVD